MSRLIRAKLTKRFIETLEPVDARMQLKRGVTAEGFQPKNDDDTRYFEKLVFPDGSVEWYELVD